MESTPITATRFFRQDSKPASAPDGATWFTETDGSGNDTTSRYVFDAAADRWELESAVGPSEPTDGTPVAGATWRDTAAASAKQYDGSTFVTLGVNDHANLDNVTASQHHTPVLSFKGTYTSSNTWNAATASYNMEASELTLNSQYNDYNETVAFTDLSWTPAQTDLLIGYGSSTGYVEAKAWEIIL